MFKRSRKKGFTLIELLIVILVLAILMAVALPLYLGAVADSQKKTCRANMQTIANAAQAYRVRTSGHAYPTAIADLVGSDSTFDLQAEPICPNGGGYDLTSSDTGLTISCDYGDHGSFSPGVDSE